jgi:hypothetical protein
MKKILFALLTAVMLVQAGEAQSRRARVVNPGKWTIGGRDLARTALLAEGAELTTNAGEPLLLECPGVLIEYSCRQSPCKLLACDKTGSGIVARTIEVRRLLLDLSFDLSHLFTREARAPIIAAARAGGNPGDSVLLLDDRGVHWGPALTRVLEGRYCFRMAPLPANQRKPTTFALNWDRAVDPEAAVALSGVGPGLYSFEKGRDGTCDADPDAVPAWVLISPAADFQRLNALWRNQAPKFAELEAAELELSTVRTLRRAVLSTLADSQ